MSKKYYGGKYEVGQIVDFVITHKYEGTSVLGGRTVDQHSLDLSLLPNKETKENYEVGDKVKAQFGFSYSRFGHWVILGGGSSGE